MKYIITETQLDTFLRRRYTMDELEELKKDLKIVTRHDGDNQDNVINMIEQVMKQMITKIENF